MSTDEHDKLIEQIRKIAKELESESVPRSEFLRRSGVSERKVQRLFGSYTGLVEAADLVPLKFPSSDAPTYSDDDLLQEIIRVLRLPNSKLTRIFFEQHSKISASAAERRFGGWLNALKCAAPMLTSTTDVTLLRRIEEYATPDMQVSKQPDEVENNDKKTMQESATTSHPGHAIIDQSRSNLYGDFVNFRGLQHAPVNEQGVVFLFGMVCRELGYVVEIVKSGFPDCEAKRQVRGKTGMWQRVRIEFEYQSRNFRSHGHDPDQCDVIVCWEDNWEDCPLEVVELKHEIERLSPQLNG